MAVTNVMIFVRRVFTVVVGCVLYVSLFICILCLSLFKTQTVVSSELSNQREFVSAEVKVKMTLCFVHFF